MQRLIDLTNPDAPPLTDADVFAALAYAIASSVATDEAWKVAHPPAPPGAASVGEGDNIVWGTKTAPPIPPTTTGG